MIQLTINTAHNTVHFIWQPYKFPDTVEEQAAICQEANELRLTGNLLYKQGELVEAAKLYEQVRGDARCGRIAYQIRKGL